MGAGIGSCLFLLGVAAGLDVGVGFLTGTAEPLRDAGFEDENNEENSPPEDSADKTEGLQHQRKQK